MLSPFGKKGYVNATHYTHGSTLRTVQTILGVTSTLFGEAAAAAPLDDLFGAAAADSAAVTLTWAPSSGATSYKVMRSVGSSPPMTIASGLPGTTFTDRTVTSGATYQYAVVAVNGAGESPATQPVTVKPVLTPQAPNNLTARQTP